MESTGWQPHSVCGPLPACCVIPGFPVLTGGDGDPIPIRSRRPPAGPRAAIGWAILPGEDGRQPDNTADGHQLRGWAYRIRTAETGRGLADWICVTTWPDVGASPAARPFAFELHDTNCSLDPPAVEKRVGALRPLEDAAGIEAHLIVFGTRRGSRSGAVWSRPSRGRAAISRASISSPVNSKPL